RVRERERLRAEVDQLFGGMRGHVARTRDDRAHPFEVAALVLEHVVEEIDRAVTGRLGADHRAAVFEALAGEYAGEVVGDPLVLAEHVADLARADADVPGGHVHVGADVAIEFGHEALAEAHHLAVALALGVEVGPAFAATHREAGERVLERLLERKELEHAFVDARVEAQAALVGTDRVVVLHAVAALDMHVAGIVLPADAERHDAVRLRDAAHDLGRLVDLLVGDEAEDVLRHVLHRLDEFRLVRIVLLHGLHERREIDVLRLSHFLSYPSMCPSCDSPMDCRSRVRQWAPSAGRLTTTLPRRGRWRRFASHSGIGEAPELGEGMASILFRVVGAALGAAILAAPAQLPAQSAAAGPLQGESFRIGSQGALCEAQGVMLGEARASLYDRKWALICADVDRPLGAAYS